MRYSDLIPFVAAITNLMLAVFVFSRDWKGTLNRVCLLWGICLAVWNYGTYQMFHVPFVASSTPTALAWARFLQCGVIFLPISLLHLATIIARIKLGRALAVLYAVHAAFFLSALFGNFYLRGVRIATDIHGIPYAWYSKGGPGFFMFLVTYSILGNYAIWMLYRQLRFLERTNRTRVKLLIFTYCLLLVFGTNDTLPILGIYNYPMTAVPVLPLGSLAGIFYGLIVAHSILQHQLLDIHVTLSRTVALGVRLMFMFMFCLVLMLIAHTLFPQQLTNTAFGISYTVFVVSAVIASTLFPKLFSGGGDALERKILGDRFEYYDKVQGFIQTLPWYTDTKSLMDDFDELLVKVVKVQSYTIVLLDEVVRKFVVYRTYPEYISEMPLNLDRDSAVFQYFHTTKEDVIALNPDYQSSEKGDLERQAREKLAQFNAEFCYSFFSEEDPVGLLLLGKKNGGESYTQHDMSLMRTVVKNLSMIMNQIRLKQKILASEEVELLGRMSRGMAHDLNNLITPVSIYVQLAKETANEADASYELLPTAARNVETIQTYIKESLFYSNTLKPHLVSGRLDKTVDHSIQLVLPNIKDRNITILCDELPQVTVEHDAVLLQRMLCNLMNNAADASPNGSVIRVNLSRLPQTESNRDWFRVMVIDKGSGISKENQKKVFQPYFTTKDRGSGKRGFGLGLAICRKIVLLHGGNLSLVSEESKGTTFIVDLPSRAEAVVEKTKPVMAPSHAHAA